MTVQSFTSPLCMHAPRLGRQAGVCRAGLLPRKQVQGLNRNPALQLGPVHSLSGRSCSSGTLGRNAKSGRSVRVEAKGNDVDIADRAIGALVFLVPLFDGIRYGKFFFAQFPASRALLQPLSPLINLYYGVPFGTLVVFFGLYFGIVMNYSFSRYVRFNAMQSVLLSVLLVFPRLLEDVFRPAMSGPGLQIYISLYNTIWLFVFACVAYGVGSSLVGKVARLPLIADAADQRVM